MRIWVSILVFFYLLSGPTLDSNGGREGEKEPVSEADAGMEAMVLFQAANLQGKLDYGVFCRALSGYRKVNAGGAPLLTIIDYSQPSTSKRLFVIDLDQKEVLYNTFVAHGRNSGLNHARTFSNVKSSLKSSPGFYLTGETYRGKHGYSLRLDGLEEGINDRARDRAIVIHGADYVSSDFIKRNNRLGRSWGCPAIPEELTEEIIDAIKEGTCLYIHADDPGYLTRSAYTEP
jgi:hypothetical protein